MLAGVNSLRRGLRRASSLWEGANPLSQSLTALPAPPKGGAFLHLSVCADKAPPERKDFPRSGEDVAQRQKGESGTAQAVTEGVLREFVGRGGVAPKNAKAARPPGRGSLAAGSYSTGFMLAGSSTAPG